MNGIKAVVAACGMALGLAGGGSLQAQTVEASFKASPEVYKVIAENDGFRLIQATWKPGQRDAMHSHPANLHYWLTPCTIRWHMPDGSTRDNNPAAGQAGSGQPVIAHSVENISKSDCTILMIEPK